MKRKNRRDAVGAAEPADAERLLRAFYADELSVAEARRKTAPAGAGRPTRSAFLPARPRVRNGALAAAASLAVLAAGAAGAAGGLPGRAEAPGFFMLAESFGELAGGAGLLDPFRDGPVRIGSTEEEP